MPDRRARKSHEEATEALSDARENLRKTKARNPEVREVARSLRILREKNRFVEQLEVIMIGGSR